MSIPESQQEDVTAFLSNSIDERVEAQRFARKHEIQSRIGALAAWAGTAGFIGYEQSPGTLAAATVTAVAGGALWKVAGHYRDHAVGCAERQASDSELLSRLQDNTGSESPGAGAE